MPSPRVTWLNHGLCLGHTTYCTVYSAVQYVPQYFLSVPCLRVSTSRQPSGLRLCGNGERSVHGQSFAHDTICGAAMPMGPDETAGSPPFSMSIGFQGRTAFARAGPQPKLGRRWRALASAVLLGEAIANRRTGQDASVAVRRGGFGSRDARDYHRLGERADRPSDMPRDRGRSRCQTRRVKCIGSDRNRRGGVESFADDQEREECPSEQARGSS